MKVVVVTISETNPSHSNEVKVEVFGRMESACAWVEMQINHLVRKYGLDPQKSVDDWYVLLDGYNHTIQYSAQEVEVR